MVHVDSLGYIVEKVRCAFCGSTRSLRRFNRTGEIVCASARACIIRQTEGK